MKKIRYSPDVDAIPIEISDPPIDSSNGELVLIEILDVKKIISLASLPGEMPVG